MDDTASPKNRTYALYVRRADAGFAWKFSDRGVTLEGGRIRWAFGEDHHETPLTDIAEVHLQTNMVGQTTIATCRIRFADDFVLLVLSTGESGTYDAGQAAIYSAFVRDLHARLAALPAANVTYSAGYSAARQNFGFVLMVVAGLFFLVLPTVLLLVTGELSLVSSLYFGALLVWPLYRLVQTNAPATYDPHALSVELIDT